MSRTRSRTSTFHRQLRPLTLRQRLTLLWMWPIRSRRSWSSWFAMRSRASACRKSG